MVFVFYVFVLNKYIYTYIHKKKKNDFKLNIGQKLKHYKKICIYLFVILWFRLEKKLKFFMSIQTIITNSTCNQHSDENN